MAYTLLPTLLSFCSSLPTFHLPFWEINTPFSFQNLIFTFAFLKEFHLVCLMWLNSSLLRFPQNIFQSLSFCSYPSLRLNPGGNSPCPETKADNILFSVSSHKTIKCCLFLLSPLCKELLFLGFSFPASPILSFSYWNTIPVGLWDHKLPCLSYSMCYS